MQLIEKQKDFGFQIYLERELSKESKKYLFLRDIGYDKETGLIVEDINCDCTFLIEIHTLQGSLFAFEVDKQKNITQKPCLAKTARQVVEPKERIFGVYQKRVRIKTYSQLHIPYTTYPENHFKVIEFDLEGKVTIFEIAIISDAGILYLTFQKVHEYQIYKDEQECLVCYPDLIKWESLHHLVCDFYRDKSHKLPRHNPNLIQKNNLLEFSITNELIEKIKRIEERLGDIKIAVGVWFNFANRFGMVATSQGMARVYFDQILRFDKFPKHIGKNEKFIYQESISISDDKNTQFIREVRKLSGPIVAKQK
ncbi:hypothetical protein COZ61_00440 [Candidatus Berkelbacteria bacterium CG_4_8_14_3_um_filter_33_6]|uniref:Uncharacterized protein n=1 Tax=Candidatus Berkelbacteria bacterium CG_4_10_14_0_2_um_filter_35_9_33_12 TaxID=1974499 RepID=A0A2M7W4C1_9BACT|nr:MAG: hypothetical protein COX10_00835 [Candidatus Berkelbacteria bacterium CG23_combo_of_CG06-09_8_20_14_all_33_15]PIS08436.1 MAG: hypothetical protein COT76_01455 [Candidatus Berkelbacteria bacterium CG10_big_fil_rev_8_21_14_0_10_33_10]PIX31304.1 MAG: hypothetical protein COZ61_00440 [Candidatus Berkelbacteria bacterium CG_4_8_14_3_um_filter_33_6]PIZ28249.1 MAG: hypothetical protein COY43_01510 [Candidatus Berkelbacteria bacterium CG_4_10_14_0_8_um_filter_35_9_33_8]PJA20600.1 MAG: hypotheti